jgi:hypothetical protein
MAMQNSQEDSVMPTSATYWLCGAAMTHCAMVCPVRGTRTVVTTFGRSAKTVEMLAAS